MAAPRLLVEPDVLKARMAYGSFLAEAERFQGKVLSMTDASARVGLVA